jgi:hypothetical protein
METTQINADQAATDTARASINVSTLGVPVTVTTAAAQPNSQALKNTEPNFTPKVSVERAESDEQVIEAKSRAEYVSAFKVGVERTARATLEMCRVVYEAHKTLDAYEFANFCREIGLKDWSSTVRKFIAIGKVYPRFIKYADQLPASWTNIYLITQIPADTFNDCLKSNYPLKDLKGRELDELMSSTQEINDINKPLAYDKKNGGYMFGRVMFTKRIDDVDWRAMQKALSEVEARLPIKIVVHPKMLELVEKRKLRLYEATKQHHKHIELKPDLWDFGKEANTMYQTAKLPTAEVVPAEGGAQQQAASQATSAAQS